MKKISDRKQIKLEIKAEITRQGYNVTSWLIQHYATAWRRYYTQVMDANVYNPILLRDILKRLKLKFEIPGNAFEEGTHKNKSND